MGAGRGQYIAFGTALDELLAQALLQRMEPPRDRRVVDREHPGSGGQAAVPCERHECPDILPVELCAFLISH